MANYSCTSSYGFFYVGGFLGLTVLILFRPLLKNPTIENLINEMSQTIVLLTVGTFLGGVIIVGEYPVVGIQKKLGL
ncbi:hypothetical protein [Candidatus Walczuchella endosymbiont of Icerya purchasi]|uniref:hypothetical protein n=1 Tax=Candidatus Walczuchella endosymbiont of Icerya purchasi TaxID=3066219 RepID=UPI00313BE83F